MLFVRTLIVLRRFCMLMVRVASKLLNLLTAGGEWRLGKRKRSERVTPWIAKPRLLPLALRLLPFSRARLGLFIAIRF
jgi:hypothetical protein